MLMLFSAAFLSLHLVTMVADSVPKFDIARGCRLDNVASSGITETQPVNKCVSDEQQALQQLRKQWSQFSVLDRTTCTADTNSDSTPSYIELLTCLEMARDAKKEMKQ